MREIMYNLLSYEPVEYIEGSEGEFVKYVLDNDALPSNNVYLCELFQGYYSLCLKREKDKQHAKKSRKPIRELNLVDDLKWLKDWKNKYHSNYREDRLTYPVLFKKICFYIIVTERLNDQDFVSAIDFKVKMIANWNIYTKYRKLADDHKHLALRFSRNGKKQSYLTDIIESMYFECHRQQSGVEKAPKKEDAPVFVDVYTGTGSVAASIDISSEKKVLNDFDRLMIATIYVIRNYRDRLGKRIFEYHTMAINDQLPKNLYTRQEAAVHLLPYYSMQHNNSLSASKQLANEALFVQSYWDKPELFVTKEERAENKARVPRNIEMFYCIRNLFKYCEDRVLYHSQLKYYDYNAPIDESDLENIIDLVACNYIYSSFSGRVQDSTPNISGIDFDSYGVFLDKVFNTTVVRNADGFRAVKPVRYPMNYLNDWVKSLKNSVIGSLSFEELYQDDRAFYYHDSPYYGTKQYNVNFPDSFHVQMQNILRGSKFKWLFSLQYFKGNYESTASEDGDITIKNYYTYCTGFLSELEQKGKHYIATYPLSKVGYPLYVTLVIKEGKQATHPEIFISNFEAYNVMPYSGKYVPMPFEEFLNCVGRSMQYSEVVEKALELYRNKLRGYIRE